MDGFVIQGGRPLRGRVEAAGSKNAALPILIASLLTDETCEIGNVPDLRDIRTTFRLLECLGKKVEWSSGTAVIRSHGRLKTRAPYELVKQMRASVLVAGPLLARFRRVQVPMPGGCAIGMRPIDIHVKGFVAMGATQSFRGGDLVLRTPGLKGRRFRLPFPSVGATENLLTAAAAVEGETVLENAAREPEIADLGRFLQKMGADVSGLGSSTVRVRGARRLRGAVHPVIPDRLETGTLLLAAAATGGDVTVSKTDPSFLSALLAAMRRAGLLVDVDGGSIRVRRGASLKATSIVTKPHPGFPTDLQAPWMALMSLAKGRSVIRETIFEKRFMHAAELVRMGAKIGVDGDTATVEGVGRLSGAPIMASDIRAGAALIVAALAAQGETEISRIYHIERGYERIEEKLRALGARIRRTGK